jgi:hypothetical protein
VKEHALLLTLKPMAQIMTIGLAFNTSINKMQKKRKPEKTSALR